MVGWAGPLLCVALIASPASCDSECGHDTTPDTSNLFTTLALRVGDFAASLTSTMGPIMPILWSIIDLKMASDTSAMNNLATCIEKEIAMNLNRRSGQLIFHTLRGYNSTFNGICIGTDEEICEKISTAALPETRDRQREIWDDVTDLAESMKQTAAMFGMATGEYDAGLYYMLPLYAQKHLSVYGMIIALADKFNRRRSDKLKYKKLMVQMIKYYSQVVFRFYRVARDNYYGNPWRENEDVPFFKFILQWRELAIAIESPNPSHVGLPSLGPTTFTGHVPDNLNQILLGFCELLWRKKIVGKISISALGMTSSVTKICAGTPFGSTSNEAASYIETSLESLKIKQGDRVAFRSTRHLNGGEKYGNSRVTKFATRSGYGWLSCPGVGAWCYLRDCPEKYFNDLTPTNIIAGACRGETFKIHYDVHNSECDISGDGTALDPWDCLGQSGPWPVRGGDVIGLETNDNNQWLSNYLPTQCKKPFLKPRKSWSKGECPWRGQYNLGWWAAAACSQRPCAFGQCSNADRHTIHKIFGSPGRVVRSGDVVAIKWRDGSKVFGQQFQIVRLPTETGQVETSKWKEPPPSLPTLGIG